MDFGPSSNKMDTSVIDKVRETSRRSLHCKVKRKYVIRVSCEKCRRWQVVSQVTFGYQCSKCGKYNDVEEASKRYDAGSAIATKCNYSTAIDMPAVKTSDGRDYVMLRDESEIRADWFINGKTRDSMGVQKFDRSLKKELQVNNCYRGDDSNVG